LIKARQNPAKAQQSQSKELARIPLDFVIQIEPFPTVALTPEAIFSFGSDRAR
jgi:hypothetical protein